jgi:uroporphyrinogen decarboxylase
MSMTPQENIDALLRGKPAERVGLHEGLWSDTYVRWMKEGYPTHKVYKEAGETVREEGDGFVRDVVTAGEYIEPVPAWQHFGYDMLGVGGWFDTKPLRGLDELVSETDEWEIRRNGAGASFKRWKHKMGTPEHIDFRMTTREIWESEYKPHLLEFDPLRTKVADTRKSMAEARQAKLWKSYGGMFIWELGRGSLGDITLYSSLLNDPDWIHDFNRTYTDFYKKYYQYYFDEVGLPDGIWMFEDMGYNAGLFASPKTFASMVFPYFREMIEFFHSYNLPVVLHSCGSVAQALPMIVDVGFDALNPMERKARNNDPYAFAKQYGDKLAFIGGLDVRVLETNDKDIVRKEVGAYIDGMKALGARLVFASDHSVPPTISYDTYRYAVDVYREHMWY